MLALERARSWVNQLRVGLKRWQAKSYIIRALVWVWVVAFVFSIVLSVLGIPSFYHLVVKGRAIGDGAGEFPLGLLCLRMGGAALELISFSVAAVWLMLNRAGRGMPLLAAYVLLGLMATGNEFADAYVVHDSSSPTFLNYPFFTLRVVANIAFVLFALLFPTGRFVPRSSRYFAVFWVLLMVVYGVAPSAPLNFFYYESFTAGAPASYIFVLVCFAVPLACQIYRHFYVSSELERHQSRWIVFGMAAMMVSLFFDYGYRGFLRDLFPLDAQGIRQPRWLITYVRLTVIPLGFSLFPLTLCYALFKHRIWRVDPFIRRSIVYSSLSLIIVLIYGSTVGLLRLLFEQRLTFFVSLVAAGVVSVLFQPLKQALQHKVNHSLYGQRDDPYKVLTNLSERVKGTLDSQTTLRELCTSTARVLNLPFVGIWLSEARTNPIASSEVQHAVDDDAAAPDLVDFPLIHESKPIGLLKVARRSRGEPFTGSEMLLLQTIAQQVSVLARNYLLNQALQRSRERLVLSREEERRRIRRDLHDGLAPTLASTAMQLEMARKLIYSRPDEGARILQGLEEKMSLTLSTIRALVHDLYPTAIDQLGLQAALASDLKAFESEALQIRFEVVGELEGLPAAVEVAVYRIVMEAVHNVQKHARATRGSVTLKREGTQVSIRILDDGVGFEETYGDGLGLPSIRERAEELGGTAQVERVTPRGTLVRVRLPSEI